MTERNWTTLLFNPFVYVAGARALTLGVAGILAASAAGLASRTHFDGVLDMHSGAKAPVVLMLVEGLVDWLCLGLVLVILGKLVSRSAFRVLDVLGTEALARWPAVVMVLLTLPPAFQNYAHELVAQLARNPLALPPITPAAIYFFAVSLLLLPLLVWMIVLMYKAYAVSCNVRGVKAAISFSAGLILAEILSKIVIYRMLR